MKEYFRAVLLKYKMWPPNNLCFGLSDFCNVPAEMVLEPSKPKEGKDLSFICFSGNMQDYST